MPTSRPLSLPWRLLEAYFQRRYHIRTLDNDPDSLIAYNLYPHKGPEVPLRCGAVIRPGDLLLEIHFRRDALQRRATSSDPARLALALLLLGDRDVPRLARALEREPELRQVKALHALTLFHRGITRYGFEVQPVRERWAELWFTAWHRLLMARDHPGGGKRVQEHREKLVTRHVWISREELLRRFPAAPSHDTDS
jgi:peptidoglycan-N-acetylglucosamine deacetylase